MKGAKIHISGIVQGVGFRPFVYNLATRLKLNGFCLNDSEGVVIELHGNGIDVFVKELTSSPPPLSKIDRFELTDIDYLPQVKGFEIRESLRKAGAFVQVSPDIAICADCERELLDPSDRRYLYPFINCTNCGPRYSIVLDIPYDRHSTTMAPFKLCEACEKEYHDPSDRRFHAQPNACAECGPKVWLEGGGVNANFEAIKKAQRLLKAGAILAIKGLGGFHLACDAQNEESVARLRALKRRSLDPSKKGSKKPFAIMVPDAARAASFASLSEDEKKLLEGRIRPIVLLEKLPDPPLFLSESIAPENKYLGVMLPYTPLHHLLFHDSPIEALVMTSGNLAEEPINISNKEALARLSGIAEHFLLHDRDIYMRVDDSIVRQAGGTRVLRRARGYAPSPVEMHGPMEEVLACGALLKNTFCITKGSLAIMSQHIGDLENFEALEFYKESIENIKRTFRAEPVIVAHDMHPDYMSTSFAAEYAKAQGIPEDRVIPVQHHHAHIVGCMAEHGLAGKVIGAAFDGTGLGTDGQVWGGEFLIADRAGFTRPAHLSYVRLPGGDAAVKEPWRMALSYLYSAFGDGLCEIGPFRARMGDKKTQNVLKMIKTGLNSPMTSSAGRLFDAVSSILGFIDTVTFEAEAAILLEHNASPEGAAGPPYPFEISDGETAQVSLAPAIRAIVSDLISGVDKKNISGRFHATMACVIAGAASRLRDGSGINDVALSGGVFQNKLLTGLAQDKLKAMGFKVWSNCLVPANDGGVSLGQAASAWERIKRGK